MRRARSICRRALPALAALAAALLVSRPAEAAAPSFYWESPARLSKGTGAFPQALDAGGRVVAIWQENQASGDGGEAVLSLAGYGPDGVKRRDAFAGPFRYSGEAPVLFSAAADPSGTMLVAVSSGERSIAIYKSADGGQSFSTPAAITTAEPVVAPRVFARAGGGWHLFVTRGESDALSIMYSNSADGSAWSELKPFVEPESGLRLNFLPAAASISGVDVVVFQTLAGGDRPSFQLYAKTSRDGGATWTPPKRVTDFLDPVHRDRRSADDFDNQRPHLARIGSSLWLVWERRLLSGNPQVYAAILDQEGAAAPASVTRVSLGQGSCSEPRLLEVAGEPAVAWFDDKKGVSRIFAAFRTGTLWNEVELSAKTRGESAFGRAVYARGGLYAFWQTGKGPGSSVTGLVPDTSVSAPEASAADFNPGEATRRSRASVRWTVPSDSSGVAGFSYLWSRDPAAEPPRTPMALETQTSAAFDADADGDWYFSVRAEDYAGNWSAPSRLRFVRDTTPPGAPATAPPPASADGFLSSNTFSMTWTPPPEPDVAGYTWALEFLGPLDRPPARKLPTAARAFAESGPPATGYSTSPVTPYEIGLWNAKPPSPPAPSIRTAGTRADFNNLDDGYWAFSVAAVDKVGNVGQASTTLLRADKFIPFTQVADVAAARDDFGSIRLSVVGRGFVDDGAIAKLAIDADGAEPYDRLYELAAGGYAILSDRLLNVPEVADLPAGAYRVGLFHPTRGWYFTRPRLSVDYSGTVKFGERGEPWRPTWSFAPAAKKAVSVTTLFLIAALVLPALGAALALRQVVAVAGEIRIARLEAIALLEGKPMPALERKRAAEAALRRGAGLTAKFALTISVLVILVVLLVSLPLSVRMLGTQSEILARGLEQRSRVLLESAAQGGKSYLPARNILELSLLPNQASAVDEALYLTITGFGTAGATDPDIVWASNDPEILTKIDGQALVPGSSTIRDPLSDKVKSMAAELDAKALSEAGEIAEAIQQLQDEGRILAARLDEQSQARLAQIASSARDLERTLNERLASIANASVASEPSFDPKALGAKPREFIFYKPIMFRQGRETVYYRGLVRLAVSTESIVKQVGLARATLIRSVGVVAAIALAIGIVGSFALSGLIVKPLLRVVDGIKKIRDEPDKKKLDGFSIDIKSRDELEVLAGTINEMTAGLVEAAKEAEQITVGKEVQKMFIPLSTNDSNQKISTGFDDQPTHLFFGYWEGAKGVSGDFFDYRPLDGRYWAFIKCDVSGKGVPAALIMVSVATIFATEFKDWSYAKNGIHLDSLAYKINDFIVGLNIQGRFAALMMGIFDSKTGAVTLCQAGDNKLHIYKPALNKVIEVEYKQAAATGVFSRDLVDMKSPYKQERLTLDSGDMLLLYTDGFEDSSRVKRDKDFKDLLKPEDASLPQSIREKAREKQDEKLGEPAKRLFDIMEAIMSRGTYVLRKLDDPLGPDVTYDFDFSALNAGPEDLVLGMAAVEKVFRLNPDPTATDADDVVVDDRIDGVLSKCWKQYDRFCSKKGPHPDPKQKEYLVYRGMKEDPQYDDLTMMLIKRK